ncbi:MAG: hypothetical protein COA36_10165 [Desulfotalea sp.]|nr:MAG: hypothetical protein COA36_10165 [Desulfotalea sp.]
MVHPQLIHVNERLHPPLLTPPVSKVSAEEQELISSLFPTKKVYPTPPTPIKGDKLLQLIHFSKIQEVI